MKRNIAQTNESIIAAIERPADRPAYLRVKTMIRTKETNGTSVPRMDAIKVGSIAIIEVMFFLSTFKFQMSGVRCQHKKFRNYEFRNLGIKCFLSILFIDT